MKVVRALILIGVLGIPLPGGAAELDGVTLPDTERVAGTELRLNGIGLRSYSVFQVPIYVAGLYLVRPSNDANQILHSPDTKLLEIRFVHDVSVEQSRKAWRDGFERNCVSPCQVAPQDVERFLSFVPAVRKGDSYSLLFTAEGAEVISNGHRIGSVPDPLFAQAMLTTFLGPQPPTPRLKRELLGAHE
jgi:Chalcone isomerase-like